MVFGTHIGHLSYMRKCFADKRAGAAAALRDRKISDTGEYIWFVRRSALFGVSDDYDYCQNTLTAAYRLPYTRNSVLWRSGGFLDIGAFYQKQIQMTEKTRHGGSACFSQAVTTPDKYMSPTIDEGNNVPGEGSLHVLSGAYIVNLEQAKFCELGVSFSVHDGVAMKLTADRGRAGTIKGQRI